MRRILLVEDEPLLQETYQVVLSTQPYECDFAENGREALEKCAQHTYDLILLDLMMPVMSGVEFLENLETLSKLDEIKNRIIIMSNLSSGKELNQARALGVQNHILKSDMSPKQLISAIRYQFEA